LRILQPKDGYRAGIDAVLLAAAAPIKAGRKDRVLDVGAGVGVVGLAVARRAPRTDVTLVEREWLLADLARCNIERNGLQARVRLVQADVSRRLDELPELRSDAESFDHVLANPLQSAGCRHHLRRGTEGYGQRHARWQPRAGHASWPRWAPWRITMIHRADAIGEVLSAFADVSSGLIVFPLYPREGKSAIRVLVQGVKGSNAPVELLPGLVLHDAGNRFRPEAEAILRQGAGLSLRNRPVRP
jgi:tRNA1(Val) A37 N6-methylase TrmN6